LRSNPGLKLANAFGVNPGLKLANAFGVNPGLELANAFVNPRLKLRTPAALIRGWN
jgi:predicted outer membrane lipoprotein